VASQDLKPAGIDCVRYMHLGFLQSEPHLKFERLYIALKEQRLNFSSERESMLIKQTLFEVSTLMQLENRYCSLLEWCAFHNPTLVYQLGIQITEKALALRYRLTQHEVVKEVLE